MTDTPIISDAEIQKIEAQVKTETQNERAALEANIRKELAAEARAKELESQLAAQQKVADEAKAEAARVKAEADALVKKAAEERLAAEHAAARSKQPVTTANPFKGSETQKLAVTPQDIPAIDSASYNAMREKFKR